MKFTLHQCHLKVGDVAHNLPRGTGDSLHLWPELTLAGYQPEDLVRHHDFITACQALPSKGQHLFGTIAPGAYNAARLTVDGTLLAETYKHCLPNYGVFDELRVFKAGALPMPITYQGVRLGVLICEDMWFPEPAAHLKEHGAEILIVLNGSPYEANKLDERMALARARVQETGLPLIYLNRVGGQDETVFDGQSFALNADGTCILQMPAFDAAIAELEFLDGILRTKQPSTSLPARDALDYAALVTGLRDYVRDNGFSSVLIGLSGGIDSALVAAIAFDALGADKVHCVGLPTRFTAQQSYDDAHALVKNLGCSFEIIAIEPALTAMDGMLGARAHQGLAFENLQSRLRGAALMTLSNATGALVLATGNKSEYAVGYSTLYGDMCGAYAPIKDVYKTRVYDLCAYRGAIIPRSIIDRPPTAELRADQTDQDSLPPYDTLDDILERLIEGEQSPADIITAGYDRKLVLDVAAMVKRAEYKRRQAAPGPKITRRAFGRERRLPITNGFPVTA